MTGQAQLAVRVRQLELRARKQVSHIGEGAYRSAFKGHGVEFQEIREYVPGDDIRTIDWNVTARHDRAYVRRYAEEREQTIVLLVDGSLSTDFGSKRDVIAELAATLAFASVDNGDKVGLILFGASVEKYLPPAASVNHALRIVHEVLRFRPRRPGTDIARALTFLDRISPRRVFAFLISDYLAPDASAQLRISANRHNLVALRVNAGLEFEMPDCGLVEFTEPETGARSILDTSDAKVRDAFAAFANARKNSLRGVDQFNITAGEDYFPALLKFLRAHARHR